MKFNNKIFLALTTCFLFSYGCDKYVEVDPPYALDAENYFLSEEDYDRALTGAYDMLQTSYLSLWIGEIASDNSIAGGESVTDTPGLHDIDNMTHGGVNSELRSIWRWMYAGITRVNFMFVNRDNIDFPEKQRMYAEAHFLRAYYYSELVKFFGDVPLVLDELLGVDEVSTLERSATSVVYDQIESDLLNAADGLEWTSGQKGRITKGAALSLLGKVYLYRGKYSEAALVLDQVIQSEQYVLYDDLENLFRLSSEGNSESVFEIQYVGVEGGSYDCFVCLEGFAAVGFHGIRNYDGPIYADGNSYNLPTQDLVDAFEEGDPRLELSVLDIEAFIAEQGGDISYTAGAGGHTGFYNHKYLKRADELGAPDTDLTSPVNHRVIRYADVLLMAAEAHNKNNNDEQARTYLNLVRERADMEEITSSGTQLEDDIFHERRVELAGEGYRFFDLVRTDRADEEIDGFQQGKHEVFPIPQDEIDLAGAGWTQNSGY